MSRPLVSVVIPTRNGARTLPGVLQALARQTLAGEAEVVAVDSGSTDGTLRLLEGRVDRLLQVSPESFNHGATRNLGIGASRGELVALLVQDAEPAGEEWLAELVKPLVEEPAVAGSFARQQPRPGASALTLHYLADWAGCSEAPRLHSLAGAAEFERLTPVERLARCTFDNVSSCLRRAVWESHPLPVVEIAEDVAWAKAVLLAGHKLAYAPRAVVLHSHERPPCYELCRTWLVHHQLRRLFGLRTIGTRRQLALAVLGGLRLHARLERRSLARHPAAFLRALGLAVAFPLGQYLGARSADTGAAPPRRCRV
jgi:rhamnosyltransferase